MYTSLAVDLKGHPALICGLAYLEEEMKRYWPFDPSRSTVEPEVKPDEPHGSILSNIAGNLSSLGKAALKKMSERDTGLKTEAGEPVKDVNGVGELTKKIGVN